MLLARVTLQACSRKATCGGKEQSLQQQQQHYFHSTSISGSSRMSCSTLGRDLIQPAIVLFAA
jgi:hypothetical protein